uniref:Tachykinin-like peptide-IV n=1 Tax=Phoneutria nigriventer TaxID=6918 RepID=TLP4_PHONI|nr:RecName: Full=Tachykinin-like peptide-IV; AltName: Full=P.nigriventer tachykinin peptides IV; Short=PnTkP-IV; AltName: Full=U29-ctenitoxin-Pn1d; Short=U29-CNTX-Pn1d [Phoneutria nigriventer]
QKKDKKDKF